MAELGQKVPCLTRLSHQRIAHRTSATRTLARARAVTVNQHLDNHYKDISAVYEDTKVLKNLELYLYKRFLHNIEVP